MTTLNPMRVPSILLDGVVQNVPSTEAATANTHIDEPATKPQLNPEEEEFRDALATLMWRKDLTARPLYDHVSAMIRHIFTTQAKSDVWTNKLDLLSRLVKRYNVPPVAMHFIKTGNINPLELPTFQKIRDYFAVLDDDETRHVDHNGPMPGSNQLK